MFLIEIATPAGSLASEDRAMLTADLLKMYAADGEAPEATLSRGRMMTHFGFNDLEGWTTGDGPWQRGGAPPIWITVTVPEDWRAEVLYPTMGALRRSVRAVDRRNGWERAVGSLWINVVGIQNDSIGLNGKPSTADDVVDCITAEFRQRYAAGEVDVPEGVLVDPMCGMHVRLGPRAITIEHNGETLGFCALSCRAAYARRHEVRVPA